MPSSLLFSELADWLCFSGSRSSAIHHHDVRVAQHLIGSAQGHTQEVCGLQWSPDGKYLASGGNDNVLNIWSNDMSESSQPLHSFNQHQAAVKALAWCPWQPSLLASGGGTADRCIKIWNCNSGVCLNSVDTKSQARGLLHCHYSTVVLVHRPGTECCSSTSISPRYRVL